MRQARHAGRVCCLGIFLGAASVSFLVLAVALVAYSLFGLSHFAGPDYVLSSAFPKIIRLGHGLVCATATANRGTMAAKSARQLKRYWTSAR